MGALTNLGGLLDMNPLAIILQQELVAPWSILQGNAVDGPGPKNSHASCCLKGTKGAYWRVKRHQYKGMIGGTTHGASFQHKVLGPDTPVSNAA